MRILRFFTCKTVCDVFAFYFVSYYSIIYTREEFNFIILLFVNQKIGKKMFHPRKMEDKKIKANSIDIMKIRYFGTQYFLSVVSVLTFLLTS